MKTHRLTCAEFVFILFLFAVALILSMIFLAADPARAADLMPTVCRDTSYTAGIRYKFENIPYNWINKVGIWWVAADTEMDGNTMIADAITYDSNDATDLKAGDALLGTADYTVILRGTLGTSDTLPTQPCDQPPATTPEPTPCPAWAINGETGALVCLWDLPYAEANP